MGALTSMIARFFCVCLVHAGLLAAQTPPQKPAPKPPGKSVPAPAATETVPSPVSRHYPILILAHGNEPFWALRLGMKGPERLDRVGYPPIILDPAEVSADEAGTVWTYHAKDDATSAPIAVKLSRETCSDGMSDVKYTFKVVVEHAQIG